MMAKIKNFSKRKKPWWHHLSLYHFSLSTGGQEYGPDSLEQDESVILGLGVDELKSLNAGFAFIFLTYEFLCRKNKITINILIKVRQIGETYAWPAFEALNQLKNQCKKETLGLSHDLVQPRI